MGQYEPDDSRDVTLNANSAPGEPPRTGPRESQTRKDAPATGAGASYGNSRDEDGQQESDMAKDKSAKKGKASNKADRQEPSEPAGEATAQVVGETSDQPNVQTRADANPPLI